MKILITNYRYFVSGGPERYMFNVSDALQARRHEVIPYSVRYRRNQPTPYSKFFAPPLGSADDVYFSQHTRSVSTVVKTLERLFYSPEVRVGVKRLVESTRPDVAYVLHYLRKLSPSLLVGLREAGIPIVVRLSDYQMLCPQAHFLREGEPCQQCVAGDLMPSIRNRCIKGSTSASFINAVATWFHRKKKYFDLIDRFVVTNAFMFDVMIQAGFSMDRLVLIPTFVKLHGERENIISAKLDQVVFVGRIEPLKGVHVLVEAAYIIRQRFPDVGWKFKVAGDGDPKYVQALKNRVLELGMSDHIEFVGILDKESVFHILASSRIQIVPSLWYENLPNSLLEGYAACTPTIGSDLGSLKGAIESGKTGYLFKPGDPESLADVLVRCWQDKSSLAQLGRNSRALAETEYSEESHMNRLTSLFESLVRRSPK
jgi:glycosyltransferase involved in cell wall biosynthesis